MILNTDAINDSKKISELRKLTYVTKHQENTWFPIAQYNSRTNSYHNAAINLRAITSYAIAYTTYALDKTIGEPWNNLMDLENVSDRFLESYVQESGIAKAISSYSFSYVVKYMDWQLV
jgi:hypothetical protein